MKNEQEQKSEKSKYGFLNTRSEGGSELGTDNILINNHGKQTRA